MTYHQFHRTYLASCFSLTDMKERSELNNVTTKSETLLPTDQPFHSQWTNCKSFEFGFTSSCGPDNCYPSLFYLFIFYLYASTDWIFLPGILGWLAFSFLHPPFLPVLNVTGNDLHCFRYFSQFDYGAYNPGPEDLKHLTWFGRLTYFVTILDHVLTLLWLVISHNFQILFKCSHWRKNQANPETKPPPHNY